jgi:hypothetical protein
MTVFGGVPDDPTSIGFICAGYRINPLDSIIELAWASVDSFITGKVFAWLFNQ